MTLVRASHAANKASMSNDQPSLPAVIATSRGSAPQISMARKMFGHEGVTATALSPCPTIAWAISITAVMPDGVSVIRSSGRSMP